jgi:hypothetical protein
VTFWALFWLFFRPFAFDQFWAFLSSSRMSASGYFRCDYLLHVRLLREAPGSHIDHDLDQSKSAISSI